jgi:hypothetical protein
MSAGFIVLFEQAIPPICPEVFETKTENEQLKQLLTSFARTWDRNIKAHWSSKMKSVTVAAC